MAVEVVADALVAQHHALGPSCRTAGIDEVGKSLTPEPLSQRERSRYFCAQQLLCQFGCNGKLGLAVFQNELHAVGGIVGVAWDIGCSGLQHAEER